MRVHMYSFSATGNFATSMSRYVYSCSCVCVCMPMSKYMCVNVCALIQMPNINPCARTFYTNTRHGHTHRDVRTEALTEFVFALCTTDRVYYTVEMCICVYLYVSMYVQMGKIGLSYIFKLTENWENDKT